MEKYIKKLLGFFKFEIGPITVHNFNNFGKLSNNLIIRELTNSYMVQLLCESTFNVLLNVADTAKLFASLSENRQLDMAKHKLVDQF